MLVIALVQGISEFLPISSSGHLILIPYFTGWPDQGLGIDVAVHVGTLAAIMVYFWRDVRRLGMGGLALVGIGGAHAEKRLLVLLAIGTIPAVVVGLSFKMLDLTSAFRSATLVGVNLIGYGLLLYAADRWGKQERRFEDMGLKDALLVGLAQSLALIPGTSRSGVTMTMARFLGFTRPEAARFSFLLSIPAIAGAGLLVGLEVAQMDAAIQRDALIAGIMTFFAALGAMAFLMHWLRRATMTAFVVYRVALGVLLLLLFGL